MKKSMCFLLLLVLCLSLAACQLPFELPFLDSQEQTQDYTIVFKHLEAGAYTSAMDEVYAISQGKQPADKNMLDRETIKAKYGELDLALQEKDFGTVAQLIAKMSCQNYMTQVAETEHPVGMHLFDNWYATDVYPKDCVLTLQNDGTVRNDLWAEELLWVVEFINACSVQIRAYDMKTAESIGEMFAEKAPGANFLFTFTRKTSSGQIQFVHNQLLSGYYADKWVVPAEESGFPQCVVMENDTLLADDVRYVLWEEDGQIIAKAEEGEGGYEITVREFAAGRYVLELTKETARVAYYRTGEDLDYGTMLYHYERALQILPLLKGSEDGLDYNGDDRSQQAWFDYVYNAMVAANGYGDSTAILERFVILNDLLVGVGEQRDLLMKEYKYDSQGRLIYAKDADLTLQYYGAINLGDGNGTIYSHQYYYEYDASGRVSKITHRDFQTLVSTITPVYDEGGKIDRLDIQMADGTARSANYVYDSDMMMPFSTVPTAKEMDVLREISYGDFFLNFSWTPDFENYWFSGVMGWIAEMDGEISYSSTWETDENHVLMKKTITRSGDGWETVEIHTYTYDENGRLLSETVVYGEGEDSWQTTHYYYYESIYFYQYDAV